MVFPRKEGEIMQRNLIRAAILAAALLTGGSSVLAQIPDDPVGPEGGGPIAPLREFWVGSWGNALQTWVNCTPTTPFLTLDQARLQVRQYRTDTNASPQSIIVHIAGGVYSLSSPVIFTAEDGGWPGLPIQYVAWNPGGIGGVNDDDALFSGGMQIQGWMPTILPNGTLAYVASVPAWITDIRDVWVNNQRMVRARFPNVPTCSISYSHPEVPPCPNGGYLVATRVEAFTDGVGGHHQVITVRNPFGSIPILGSAANWSHVEASATRLWVNPQQRVGSGTPVPGQPDQLVLEFPVTSLGILNDEQDIGGLGCFYFRNWDVVNPQNNCKRSYLQVVGEEDVTNPTGNLPHRDVPAQLFLTNDLAFLDADREWYFDQQNHQLFLKVCTNPNTVGMSVTIPVARQLLVLDRAASLTFDGLSFAFTHQPFPVMADGVTPGYASIQSGQVWWDGVDRPFWNNMVDSAIAMLGAQNSSMIRCRVAHAGGSGLIIGTYQSFDTPPSIFIESNNCSVIACDLFDIGAHGVYVGDERSNADDPPLTNWAASNQSSGYSDPSNNILIAASKIENFAVNYRDCVGIYAGHTRNLVISNNEISYGNYDGISVGTTQEHNLPATIPTCSGIEWKRRQQNGEGTAIYQNNIHHVMLKLTDGGGIYMQGSHIAGSTIFGNYIHDIVLNPFVNRKFETVCKGMYFESGSDGWFVVNNYTERCQGLYSFNTGYAYDHNCQKVPSTRGCDGSGGERSQWWAPTWPTPWLLCPNDPYRVPAQYWPAWQNSNIWLDPTTTAGPYGLYSDCIGYGTPTSPPTEPGGMYTMTAVSPGSASNVIVKSPGDATYGGRIFGITKEAGPEDNVPYFFFPSVVKRIHRWPICNESVEPASQIQ